MRGTQSERKEYAGSKAVSGPEFFFTASGFYRPAMCLSVLHFLPNVYCLLIAASSMSAVDWQHEEELVG